MPIITQFNSYIQNNNPIQIRIPDQIVTMLYQNTKIYSHSRPPLPPAQKQMIQGHNGTTIRDAIDFHNGQLIGKMKMGLNGSSNDGLIREYTERVYQSYKIKNPFSNTDGQKQRARTEMSAKKQIKISKRTGRTESPQLIEYSNSNNNKLINANAITPVKCPQLKRSLMLKSTQTRTTTHLRSRTGHLGPTSNKGQMTKAHLRATSQFIGQESKYKQQKHVEDRDNVYTSQFDAGEQRSNTKQAQTYTSDFKSNPTLLPPEQQQQLSHLCPICQEQIPAALIATHETKCPQLHNLYSLTPQQLQQYAQWKINQHLAAIVTILTNLQLGEPAIKKIEDNEKGVQGILQEMGRIIGDADDIYLQGTGNKEYIRSVMAQCGEEIKKCIWFQEIKQKLSYTIHP